jgi:hypothetical protein
MGILVTEDTVHVVLEIFIWFGVGRKTTSIGVEGQTSERFCNVRRQESTTLSIRHQNTSGTPEYSITDLGEASSALISGTCDLSDPWKHSITGSQRSQHFCGAIEDMCDLHSVGKETLGGLGSITTEVLKPECSCRAIAALI